MKLGVPDNGLKATDAPEGRPEADKLTLSAKPAIEETETVVVVDPPCVTVPEVGFTLMEKSGFGGTTGGVVSMLNEVEPWYEWVVPSPLHLTFKIAE